MEDPKIAVVDVLDVDTDKLLRNNSTSAARKMTRKLPGKRQWVLARGQDDALVAGARFNNAFGWMSLEAIWVDAELRRQGLGGRLLDSVESVARSQGCKGVNLRAYGFEAPDFFSQKGYTRVGHLPDAEAELESYWFAKSFTVPLEAPAPAPGPVADSAPETPVSWRKAKRAARTSKPKAKTKSK